MTPPLSVTVDAQTGVLNRTGNRPMQKKLFPEEAPFNPVAAAQSLKPQQVQPTVVHQQENVVVPVPPQHTGEYPPMPEAMPDWSSMSKTELLEWCTRYGVPDVPIDYKHKQLAAWLTNWWNSEEE